jgi:rhamnulose-1-phosphate aldolase
VRRLLDDVVAITHDLWHKGWAERNAGNISVHMTPEQGPEDFDASGPWRPIPDPVPEVAGERFLFTGTGTYMRNVERAPPTNLGVIEIDGAGAAYRVGWGHGGGGTPTSELGPHLRAHAARLAATGGADRAVIHTHPPNLIALTYALDLDTVSLTRLLWEMHTECVVVFPDGCGYVPWLPPGSDELARATAAVLEVRPMAVWQHHGIVAAGPDLDTALGLIDTAEKAADIRVKAASIGPIRHRLDTGQLTRLAERFGVRPDPGILGAADEYPT